MTNGTIYSTRLVDIIHRYCIKTGFQVSLDGIKDAHNEHRKFKTGLGSFDTIIGNIPRYLKEIPHLSVRMTVTPETIKNLYESVKMVVDLGVKYIAFMLVIENEYNDDDLKCYDEQFQKIADLYVEHFPNVYIDKLDVDYKGRARDKNHPCEAGKSLITVSASGDVYPCHRFYWMNAYKMGNILDDNLVLHEDILNAKVDNMGCKNCPVDRCNRCLAMNYQLNKDVYISPKTGYCKLVGIHDKWAEYVKAKVLANGAYLKKALEELKKCY
jgi:uncharacterized protein